MNRGCLVALIAFAVCVIFLFIVVPLCALYMFDVIRSAPRVPVAAFVTDKTVAAVVVDPNQPSFLDMINQGGGNWGWFLPYEAGIVADLDPAGKTRTVTLAGSPKHLGPLIMMMFGDKNAFPVHQLETPGIDTWLTPALTREKGALILRGTGAVETETEKLAVAHWPEAAPRVPVKLEGGHAVEAIIQNHSGEGIRALHPFFRGEDDTTKTVEKMEEAGQPQAESDAGQTGKVEEEKSDETASTEIKPDTGETVKSDSIAPLLLYSTEVRIIGDFAENDTFKLVFTAQVKDVDAAATAKLLFDSLPAVLQKELDEKQEIAIAGETSISDKTVRSELTFSGFKQKFAGWLHRMQSQSRF